MQNVVCEYSGFKKLEGLGRYLGAQLSRGRSNKGNFQHIIDKMQGRLSSWKKQTLSLAGRLTLVNSVTNQMVGYCMQHSCIPRGVTEHMEKIQQDFIWNNEVGRRRIHAVSWETFCKQKKNGGMGVRKLNVMNDAMLGRIAWNIMSKPDNLCSSVLVGKYGRNSNLITERKMVSSDSEI